MILRKLARKARDSVRHLGSIPRRSPEPKGLILLYHRVSRQLRDPQLLSVTPERFEQHLAVLRLRANPMRLSDMIERIKRGRPLPQRAVAITFDDGYRDNMLNAEPLLARAGIAGTVFVATGNIASGCPYWWDAVETALLGSPLPPRLSLPFPDGQRSWVIVDEPIPSDPWNVLSEPEPGSRHAIYREVHAAVKPLSAVERYRVLKALSDAAGTDLYADREALPLAPQEIATMARQDVIDFGAHTVDHLQLKLFDADVQADDIGGSARAIAEWTGRAPTLFSYPYGTRGDYDDRSVAAVQKFEFKAAVSNYAALVSSQTSLFELPRHIVRDIPADAFERQIDAAFAGG